MTVIDASFARKLKADPRARHRAIVRTAPPAADHTPDCERLGLRVVRVSTLISAITIEGVAQVVLALEREAWVVRVEEDKAVHTM
ncbi:MAG: hypothetical protein HZB53_07030 [Chloroflexi bacterium]|nr:hypothetical protein [Chloroflexota bacterium]